jgi:hypothetical protein
MFFGLFIDTMVINTQLEMSDSELVWDIASSASAATTPNVLSELSFRDIRSLGYVINLGYMNRFDNNIAFVLEAEYADSRIQSGRAQDSDYASDNRTDEFSRSFSDIESDSINYFSLATGIKTRWLNTKGHYLSFLIGYKKHNVDITMTNGVVEIPEADAGSLIPGLNSTYNSEFRSIFAGLSTEHVFSWGTIGFRYDLYYTDLKAEADWNLRTDFAHPVSFEWVQSTVFANSKSICALNPLCVSKCHWGTTQDGPGGWKKNFFIIARSAAFTIPLPFKSASGSGLKNTDFSNTRSAAFTTKSLSRSGSQILP